MRNLISLLLCIFMLTACVNNTQPQADLSLNMQDKYLIENFLQISLPDSVKANRIIMSKHQLTQYASTNLEVFSDDWHLALEVFDAKDIYWEIVMNTSDFSETLFLEDVKLDIVLTENILQYMFLDELKPRNVYACYMWADYAKKNIILTSGEPFLFEAERWTCVVITKSRFGKTTIYISTYYTDWDLKGFHDLPFDEEE